jgi:hypothetical protein
MLAVCAVIPVKISEILEVAVFPGNRGNRIKAVIGISANERSSFLAYLRLHPQPPIKIE